MVRIGTMQKESLRYIAINDPHFSASNPGAWKIDYREELTNSLMQVFKFGEKKDIECYLWAGDIFNLKSPSNNPHWLVADVASLLMSTGKRYHLGIAGNHDLKYGSLKGLEGQPLDVLIKTGLYKLLDDNDWVFSTDAGFNVRVMGHSFNHGLAEQFLQPLQPIPQMIGADPTKTYTIAIGHFWFGGQTGVMFGEPVYGPDYFKDTAIDCFVIGHHHEDQGAVQVGNKWYCSQGSITRVGAHKADLHRKPAAAYIEVRCDGIQVQLLYPKVTPADLCFDLEVRERIVQEKKELEVFVQSIRDAKWTTSDPKAILTELVTEKAVLDRATQYLTEAESAL